MDFHFLVMEKSWKINVEKERAPVIGNDLSMKRPLQDLSWNQA